MAPAENRTQPCVRQAGLASAHAENSGFGARYAGGAGTVCANVRWEAETGSGMFRNIFVAALACSVVAPASAQSVRELSGDMWSCRLTSLIGDPGGDMTLTFGRTGDLDAEFYFEVPSDEDVISMQFSISGTWSLNGSAVNMTVSDSELTGGWLNGVDLDQATKNEMEASLGDQLDSFSGESRVGYITQHALVLEEDDTSMSCWR
jgi:hypothetical protein